jgi:hypothetical protein
MSLSLSFSSPKTVFSNTSKLACGTCNFLKKLFLLVFFSNKGIRYLLITWIAISFVISMSESAKFCLNKVELLRLIVDLFNDYLRLFGVLNNLWLLLLDEGVNKGLRSYFSLI